MAAVHRQIDCAAIDFEAFVVYAAAVCDND
jgi:hypothetical protein